MLKFITTHSEAGWFYCFFKLALNFERLVSPKKNVCFTQKKAVAQLTDCMKWSLFYFVFTVYFKWVEATALAICFTNFHGNLMQFAEFDLAGL